MSEVGELQGGQANTLIGRVLDGQRGAVATLLNHLEGLSPDAWWLPSEAEAWRDAVDTLATSPRDGCCVVGLTGPPGVGKSTLAGRLVQSWRDAGHSVGVVAVDPSSRLSGGALLGDRARMGLSGRDDHVFVRSMAARDTLGGLAPASEWAVYVMRAAWDRVLVETVGVGQSETDIAEVADVTVVALQPGSGDTLQFIKSGLMEVPDIAVVNKSDLGDLAKRAATDLRAAFKAVQRRETPILDTSGLTGAGVERLVRAIEEHLSPAQRTAKRKAQVRAHIVRMFAAEFGQRGLRAMGGRKGLVATVDRINYEMPRSGPIAVLRRLAKTPALSAVV